MKKIALITCIVIVGNLLGTLIPQETRYQIYEMTATEEQMVDETWKMFWTHTSAFRKLAADMLLIDIKGEYNMQFKQVSLPKIVYLERELLKSYAEGLNKIEKIRPDGIKIINYSLIKQYRKTFFETIKDNPKMKEILTYVNSMSGSTTDFIEWVITERKGMITSTLKRHIKWKEISQQEKINWIYRYAFSKNYIAAQERTNKRAKLAKGRGEVAKRQNENGKPAIMPLKINRKAIGSK